MKAAQSLTVLFAVSATLSDAASCAFWKSAAVVFNMLCVLIVVKLVLLAKVFEPDRWIWLCARSAGN